MKPGGASARGLQSLAVCAVFCTLFAACRGPEPATPVASGPLAGRHHELFVPVDTPNLPLVIALHGNGGTGKRMEQLTQLDRIAAREQFIVVYPDGVDRHWNDGRPELETGVDDVAYIRALIDELAERHSIDRSRVYVTGLSNGAMMAFRLGCDLADRIAAIAPVTGNIPAAIRCEPTQPVSLLLINGTADPLVPYEGGVVGARIGRHRGSVLGTAMSVEHFAQVAHCDSPQTTDEPDLDPADGTRTRRTRYTCPAGVGVELLTVDGGGHTWPGGPQYLPARAIGLVSRDFDASERIWEFFAPRGRAPGIPAQPR
jgi:polyhydroxybutyrate depolymerase